MDWDSAQHLGDVTKNGVVSDGIKGQKYCSSLLFNINKAVRIELI